MIRHFVASFLIPVSEQRSVLDNKQKANRFPLPSLPTEFRVSLSLRKQCKPESTTNLSLFVRHDCYRLSGCKYGSLRTNHPFVTIFTIIHHLSSIICHPSYTPYKPTNDMSTKSKRFQQPHDDYKNDLELLSSWNAWSMRRKRSKHNLLDDLIDIDSIVQRHMTITSYASATLQSKKEKVLFQHRFQLVFQQNKLEYTKPSIAKYESQGKANRETKQNRAPWHDQRSRVPKVRRLNYHSSNFKLPSGRDNHQNSDNQFLFWKNLNAFTGNIPGKRFDLTH